MIINKQYFQDKDLEVKEKKQKLPVQEALIQGRKNIIKENSSSSGEEIIDTHEYVDLGLPSGTLWATVNVGAENSNEIGNLYEFTELDQAIQDWGGTGWAVPTKEQYDELNGYKGYEYGSFENNSEELYFVPTQEGEQQGIGYAASWSYWTSTEENQSKAYRESASFYMTNGSYTVKTASVNKTFKGAVRLVKVQS